MPDEGRKITDCNVLILYSPKKRIYTKMLTTVFLIVGSRYFYFMLLLIFYEINVLYHQKNH